MTIGKLNNEVIDLWKNSKYEDQTVGRLAPLLYPDGTNLNAKIVGLGLNPSFRYMEAYETLRDSDDGLIIDHSKTLKLDLDTNEELRRKLLIGNTDEKKKIEAEIKYRLDKAFEWSKDERKQEAQIALIKYLVKKARSENGLDYFKPFQLASQLCFETRDNWVHLDLLYWHRTTSGDVMKWAEGRSGKKRDCSQYFLDKLEWQNEFNDFTKKQLELTCKLLNSCCPDVIVSSFVNVVSILSSNTMAEINGGADLIILDREYFLKNGCDRIRINGKEIPLLMVSHQGNQLFDRNTAWHISQILKQRAHENPPM